MAGAVAVATRVGTSTNQSRTVTTTASGAYSFTGLERGQYQICVQTPGGPNLDPCQWSNSKPSLITFASGATTANQTMTAVKGSVLQVRINDPLQLLATSKASSDATGRTYDAAIPMDEPIRVQIHSSHLQIADNQGFSLAPVNAAPGLGALSFASASTLTVQIPAGTASQVMTFSVTGKK